MTGRGPTWASVFACWSLVEADLHQQFGIDLEDATLMSARSWRWLRNRIWRLFDEDTRIARALLRNQAGPV